MIPNCHLMRFKRVDGEFGALTAIEGEQDFSFPIRRVYYITDVPEGVTRGFHSHRNLEQILLCVHGSVKIRVKIPGREEIFALRDDSKGLYIGHMVWREMFEFSPGAVLLVLASEHYTEQDYIRDYRQYEKEAADYFREDQ